MSGFKVNFSVNNQLATPCIHAAPFAQRPAAGQPGRVFIDSDNPSTGIYRDTGSTWVAIGNPSSPDVDTLQIVTDRGNTTTNDVAIGTSSNPSAPLDVHGAGVVAILQGTGTNDSFLQYNKGGSGKFKVGNVHNAGNDYYTVYNLQENSDAILVNISTNNVALGGGTVTPSYKLDITGSLRNTGNAYLATAGGNRVGIGTTSPSGAVDIVTDIGSFLPALRVQNTVNGSAWKNIGFFVGAASSTGSIGDNVNLGIKQNTAAANNFSALFFYNNADAGTSYIATRHVNHNSSSTSDLLFGNSSAGSPVTKMQIFSSGNVLIQNGGTFTDSGQRLQVNGTSSLGGDVTITTTTSARTLTINKASSYNAINFQVSTSEISFNNGSGITIQVPGCTFIHGSSILTFQGYQNSAAINFKEGSTNTSIFYIKNGDTQQWNWAKNLKIDGATSASECAASSILELSSTTKGFLPPRMTGAQAEAITTPAAGLLVYANNGNGVTITTTGWWGYDGAAWVKLN